MTTTTTHTVPTDREFEAARYRKISRKQWPFTEYLVECWDEKGVGCDGCYCPCHSAHAPNFQTYAEVIAWHTEPVLP